MKALLFLLSFIFISTVSAEDTLTRQKSYELTKDGTTLVSCHVIYVGTSGDNSAVFNVRITKDELVGPIDADNPTEDEIFTVTDVTAVGLMNEWLAQLAAKVKEIKTTSSDGVISLE